LLIVNFRTFVNALSRLLKFAADRITEQAIEDICAVDELQDIDGSAFVDLQQAITKSAGTEIAMVLSARVGGATKEQFGFLWSPIVVRFRIH